MCDGDQHTLEDLLLDVGVLVSKESLGFLAVWAPALGENGNLVVGDGGLRMRLDSSGIKVRMCQ